MTGEPRAKIKQTLHVRRSKQSQQDSKEISQMDIWIVRVNVSSESDLFKLLIYKWDTKTSKNKIIFISLPLNEYVYDW